jgi:hypothetical protein
MKHSWTNSFILHFRLELRIVCNSLLADFKQGFQKSKLGDFADRIYPIERKRKRITDTA